MYKIYHNCFYTSKTKNEHEQFPDFEQIVSTQPLLSVATLIKPR